MKARIWLLIGLIGWLSACETTKGPGKAGNSSSHRPDSSSASKSPYRKGTVEEFKEALTTGSQFLAECRYTEAQDHFSRAREIRPKDSQLEKQQRLLQQGLRDLAERTDRWWLREAIRSKENDEKVRHYSKYLENAAHEATTEIHLVYINRGSAYYAMKNYPRAVEDFAKSAALHPTHPRPDYFLGLVYRLTGKSGLPVDSFGKSLTLLSKGTLSQKDAGVDRIKIHRARAQAFIALDPPAYKEANADYDVVIKSGKGTSNDYFYRGICRKSTGDRLGALSDFNKTLSRNKSNSSAWLWRGQIRYDSAKEVMKKHDAASKADNSSVAKRHLEKAAGLFKQAVQDYRKCVELAPDTAKAWLRMGFAIEKIREERIARGVRLMRKGNEMVKGADGTLDLSIKAESLQNAMGIYRKAGNHLKAAIKYSHEANTAYRQYSENGGKYRDQVKNWLGLNESRIGKLQGRVDELATRISRLEKEVTSLNRPMKEPPMHEPREDPDPLKKD